MFLVDKYSKLGVYHKDIIDKLIDSFDVHNEIYRNVDTIAKKSDSEFGDIIHNMEHGNWQYSNFQHLLVYGQNGCGKIGIVNKLLQKIYGKKAVELTDVEYTINGYSNTKTKVMIKQSKYHIVINPNKNGFDKYLIQEIIQNYAKTEMLSILKYKKLFKVVVIDKIDNLSYSAQAALRRTMEKYANTCKFIFICNQLSKTIEPLRSRCLLLRVPMPTNKMLTNILIDVSIKENIELTLEDYKEILQKANNNVNILLWLLEFKKHGYSYNESWMYIIEKIVDIVTNKSYYTNSKFTQIITKVREYFYILFITNINFQIIIRKIMKTLLGKYTNLELKYNIIELTSIFEKRITEGTRLIIHLEAYIIQIINLLITFNKKAPYTIEV